MMAAIDVSTDTSSRHSTNSASPKWAGVVGAIQSLWSWGTTTTDSSKSITATKSKVLSRNISAAQSVASNSQFIKTLRKWGKRSTLTSSKPHTATTTTTTTSTGNNSCGSSRLLRCQQLGMFLLSYTAYCALYSTRKPFSVVKTHIQESLGVSTYTLGAIDTAFLLFYAVGQLILPALCQRVAEPVTILLLAFLGSSLCAIGFGACSDPSMMFFLWMFNGAFHSVVYPIIVRCLAPWFSASVRGRVLGTWTTSQQMGSLLATGFAAHASSVYGWRTSFYIPGIVVGVVGISIYILMPRSTPSTLLHSAVNTPTGGYMKNAGDDDIADTSGSSTVLFNNHNRTTRQHTVETTTTLRNVELSTAYRTSVKPEDTNYNNAEQHGQQHIQNTDLGRADVNVLPYSGGTNTIAGGATVVTSYTAAAGDTSGGVNSSGIPVAATSVFKTSSDSTGVFDHCSSKSTGLQQNSSHNNHSTSSTSAGSNSGSNDRSSDNKSGGTNIPVEAYRTAKNRIGSVLSPTEAVQVVRPTDDRLIIAPTSSGTGSGIRSTYSGTIAGTAKNSSTTNCDLTGSDGCSAAATNATAPLNFRETLKIADVKNTAAAYFFVKCVRYSLLFWLPFYLSNGLGYDTLTAGYTSMVFDLGGIPGAMFTGYLSDKLFSQRRLMTALAMTICAAISLVVFSVVSSWGMMYTLISLIIAGFTLAGPDSVLGAAAAQDLSDRSPYGLRAMSPVAGMINGMGSLGAVFQGFLTASVSQLYGWQSLFVTLSAFLIFAVLLLIPTLSREEKAQSRNYRARHETSQGAQQLSSSATTSLAAK